MLSLFQIVAHEFQITQFPDPIGHKAEKRLKAQYPPKKGAMLQRPCQENLACGTKAQVEDPSSNHTANCPKSKTDPVHHMGRDLRLSRPSPRPSSDSGFKIPGSAHGDGMRSCPKACPRQILGRIVTI